MQAQPCNQDCLNGCATGKTECTKHDPVNGKCTCFGAYVGCVKHDCGCNAGFVANIVKACEEAGCSNTTCTRN